MNEQRWTQLSKLEISRAAATCADGDDWLSIVTPKLRADLTTLVYGDKTRMSRMSIALVAEESSVT